MNNLSGKNAEKFVQWLLNNQYSLPPMLRIEEARKIFERKFKKEESLKDEAKQKIVSLSDHKEVMALIGLGEQWNSQPT